MKAMQQISKRQIMLFDELKTWLASLGLYKAGGNSDYDTSLYLSFYTLPRNGLEIIIETIGYNEL